MKTVYISCSEVAAAVGRHRYQTQIELARKILEKQFRPVAVVPSPAAAVAATVTAPLLASVTSVLIPTAPPTVPAPILLAKQIVQQWVEAHQETMVVDLAREKMSHVDASRSVSRKTHDEAERLQRTAEHAVVVAAFVPPVLVITNPPSFVVPVTHEPVASDASDDMQISSHAPSILDASASMATTPLLPPQPPSQVPVVLPSLSELLVAERSKEFALATVHIAQLHKKQRMDEAVAVAASHILPMVPTTPVLPVVVPTTSPSSPARVTVPILEPSVVVVVRELAFLPPADASSEEIRHAKEQVVTLPLPSLCVDVLPPPLQSPSPLSPISVCEKEQQQQQQQQALQQQLERQQQQQEREERQQRERGRKQQQQQEQEHQRKQQQQLLNDQALAEALQAQIVAEELQQQAKVALEIQAQRVLQLEAAAAEIATIPTQLHQTVSMATGTLAEQAIVDGVERDLVQPVKHRNNHMKYKGIYVQEGWRVLVGGKPDGLVVDAISGQVTVVEVKNRQNRLFRIVPDYEQVQVQMYLWLFGAETCTFRENYHGDTWSTSIQHDPVDMENIRMALITFAKQHIIAQLSPASVSASSSASASASSSSSSASAVVATVEHHPMDTN